MVSILSDLKATLESVFSIGSAAVSGARDLIFRNTAGTIRIRGTPTGDHTITAPAATGTMVVSGQDATLSSLTVDTANITIEAKEQDSNAALNIRHDGSGVAFVDWLRTSFSSTNYGGRLAFNNNDRFELYTGSGIGFSIFPATQTWEGNTVPFTYVGQTGAATALRFTTGLIGGTQTTQWDLGRTGDGNSNLYITRYDDSAVATTHALFTRTTGATTFFGSVLLSGSTMPNFQMIGTTRSVEILAAGNNIRDERRNAISGGLIIEDWTLDAIASGADYHLRRVLTSTTNYQVIGAAGLTMQHLVDVTFEQSITFGSATGATARSFGLRNSAGTITITGTPTANATQTIQARSGTIANLDQTLLVANNLSDIGFAPTARTNLGLGTIATQNATAVDIAGKRTAINITGNVTLDSSHIGRKLRVTAAADITFSSTLGAADDEIDIIVATSGTVRVVQGSGATLTWHNGTSTQTGTRTLIGNGAVAGIYFTGTGAAIIAGGVS